MAFQKKSSGQGSTFGKSGSGFGTKPKSGLGFGRKKPADRNRRATSSFDRGGRDEVEAAAGEAVAGEAGFEETITRTSDLRRARAAEEATRPAPPPPTRTEVRDRALRILGTREHSENQLAAKLRQRGVDAEMVAEVMASMTGAGYVSDRRFGELLVRSRAARRYGPLRIARDLAAAGLGRELISEIMDTDDTDWRAVTLHAWQTKFGGRLPETPRDYAQHYRYLSGRGFTPADIRKVLKGAPADPQNDDGT